MPVRDALRQWTAPLVLLAGSALLLGAKRQELMPLALPLAEQIPDSLLGFPSMDRVIGTEEQRVAGMDEYVMRYYGHDGGLSRFSVYVGYYRAQTQGKTIHSPKNCLPGAGWEPLANEVREVRVGDSTFALNRYLLANQGARVVVYYWYQGRGRVAWNEFAVKWDLLRDKARYGRSEEALVRIVLPLTEELPEAAADAEALQIAAELIPRVSAALPAAPGG